MKRIAILIVMFMAFAGAVQAETFGNATQGGTAANIFVHRLEVLYEYNQTPGAGTMTAAKIYCWTISTAVYDSLIVIVYKKEAALADCDSVASTGWVDINQAAAGWVSLPITGTLEAEQEYVVGFIAVTSSAGNFRVYNDYIVDSSYIHTQENQYYPPADLGGTSDNHKGYWSVHIEYTPTGGEEAGDISYVRRIKLLKGK